MISTKTESLSLNLYKDCYLVWSSSLTLVPRLSLSGVQDKHKLLTAYAFVCLCILFSDGYTTVAIEIQQRSLAKIQKNEAEVMQDDSCEGSEERC